MAKAIELKFGILSVYRDFFLSAIRANQNQNREETRLENIGCDYLYGFFFVIFYPDLYDRLLIQRARVQILHKA